jgi:hypothetical protein
LSHDEANMQKEKTDLIIYHMKGCKPCHLAVPMATEYAKAAGLSYRVVDVQSEDPEDQRLSIGIRWAPTFILRGMEVEMKELAELAKAGKTP